VSLTKIARMYIELASKKRRCTCQRICVTERMVNPSEDQLVCLHQLPEVGRIGWSTGQLKAGCTDYADVIVENLLTAPRIGL
jgi:hypothetical protein